MNNKSPGGIILPNNAQKLEIVEINPAMYEFGGLQVQIPDDPGVVLQINPAVLQDAQQMLGVLSNLLNHLNALTREVDRLRKDAGLPPWPHGKAAPSPTPSEDAKAAAATAT